MQFTLTTADNDHATLKQAAHVLRRAARLLEAMTSDDDLSIVDAEPAPPTITLGRGPVRAVLSRDVSPFFLLPPIPSSDIIPGADDRSAPPHPLCKGKQDAS